MRRRKTRRKMRTRTTRKRKQRLERKMVADQGGEEKVVAKRPAGAQAAREAGEEKARPWQGQEGLAVL